MAEHRVLLSQVMVGRNDNYLGNFKNRIEMSINYTCANVAKAGCLDKYELLVVDWNSDTPLREALNLNDAALQCVKFLEVTPEIIEKHAEKKPIVNISHGMNTAIRRAVGEMVLLGPADTLIPLPSIIALFQLLESGHYFGVDIKKCYLGMERFLIPWQAAERLKLENVDRYVLLHTIGLRLENRIHGLSAGEGGHLLAREQLIALQGLAENCGGWGTQDIEISLRAMQRGPILKLTHAGIFCYDLSQPPSARMNIQGEKRQVSMIEKANDINWGLGDVVINKKAALPCPNIDNSSIYCPTPYNPETAGVCTYPCNPLHSVGKLCRRLLNFDFFEKRLLKLAPRYIARSQKSRGKFLRKIHAVLNRLSFQALAYQWVYSEPDSKEMSISAWFGNKDELFNYIEFALEQRVHHRRISWDAATVSALLAIIATLGKQQPRRFFFCPRRESYIVWAATLTDSTLEMIGYDHGRDLDNFIPTHGWEAASGEIYQSQNPNFDTLDLDYAGFCGYFHNLSGPEETAFERLKEGQLIGDPYQSVFLDLDFLAEIADSLPQKIEPLLDASCSIICKGGSEALAMMEAQLTTNDFEVIGRLPGVIIFWRNA